MIFFFNVLMWLITLIDFLMFDQTYIPEMDTNLATIYSLFTAVVVC